MVTVVQITLSIYVRSVDAHALGRTTVHSASRIELDAVASTSLPLSKKTPSSALLSQNHHHVVASSKRLATAWAFPVPI